jgi:BolA protein
MMDRISVIRRHLTEALSPEKLEIIDESKHHIGHPGAEQGGGHYAVIISCSQFKNKPLLQCHKMVYSVLKELMHKEIHALRIQIV